MNKKFKPTVAIGIPAHNEEANIGMLLQSIVLQKGKNFSLKKIEVVLDGCSDNTLSVVLDFAAKYKFIKIINDGARVGKMKRISQIASRLKQEILFIFDGDVVLAGPWVLSRMAKAFSDKSTGLAAANMRPLKGKTPVGKTLVAYENFWKEVTQKINGGDNVHNCLGCAIAFRKKFIKNILIPVSIVADDHYFYFKAVDKGYKFKWVESAQVVFKVPELLKEYFAQSERYSKSANQIEEYFGGWVSKYYRISPGIKAKSYASSILKNPLYTLCGIGLQFLRNFGQPFNKREILPLWSVVSSSK